MSEPIALGDLVVMVRGHNCLFKILGGVVFSVEEITLPTFGGWSCPRCHTASAGPNEPAATYQGCNVPFSWLKRIPPPSELGLSEEEQRISDPYERVFGLKVSL